MGEIKVKQVLKSWSEFEPDDNQGVIVCNCFTSHSKTWEEISKKAAPQEEVYLSAIREYLLENYDRMPEQLVDTLHNNIFIFSDNNLAFFTKERWREFIQAHNNDLEDF